MPLDIAQDLRKLRQDLANSDAWQGHLPLNWDKRWKDGCLGMCQHADVFHFVGVGFFERPGNGKLLTFCWPNP